MSKFSKLSLSEAMVTNLNNLGYKEMTKIQEESLPHMLNNKDIIAQAKTGSGKTAAFGISLLSNVDTTENKIQALILCPTRELVEQVARELRKIAKFKKNIKILVLSGGVPFEPQVKSLEHGAHIIVGTPGRVLKHLDKISLILESLETLVLDEAHRMLSMGFIDEIRKVIAFLPKKRQTLLFSATYSDEVLELSKSIQKRAINIETISTEESNPIEEYFYKVDSTKKIDALTKVLATYKPTNVIIFVALKQEAKDIAKYLTKRGIDALAIHGDLQQYKRVDVLIQFANRSCSVMVATDVAARGLDIKELSLVVNYSMPESKEVYTHRVGRTARAGKKGEAVTLFTEYETFSAQEYKGKDAIFKNSNTLKSSDFKLVAPNTTIVIEGGKKNKIRPGDIVGALTGNSGIEGKYIGKIDVYDKQSYVAVDKSVINQAYSHLKKGKIKAKRFPIWILED